MRGLLHSRTWTSAGRVELDLPPGRLEVALGLLGLTLIRREVSVAPSSRFMIIRAEVPRRARRAYPGLAPRPLSPNVVLRTGRDVDLAFRLPIGSIWSAKPRQHRLRGALDPTVAWLNRRLAEVSRSGPRAEPPTAA